MPSHIGQKWLSVCHGLNRLGPGGGTVKKCGLVGVSVPLLKKVLHCEASFEILCSTPTMLKTASSCLPRDGSLLLAS